MTEVIVVGEGRLVVDGPAEVDSEEELDVCSSSLVEVDPSESLLELSLALVLVAELYLELELLAVLESTEDDKDAELSDEEALEESTEVEDALAGMKDVEISDIDVCSSSPEDETNGELELVEPLSSSLELVTTRNVDGSTDDDDNDDDVVSGLVALLLDVTNPSPSPFTCDC